MDGDDYQIKPQERAPHGAAVRERITKLVRDEFIGRAGFTHQMAADMTDAVIRRAHETDLALLEKHRSGRFASRVISAAESAVSCARATALCPGEAAWWRSAGASCLTLLEEGKVSEAEAMQAELLAGPSDFEMDFNWPDRKLFHAGSELDMVVGRELVGGDGEGGRVSLRIVKRGGEVGLERIPGSAWNLMSEIWLQAHDDVHRLLLAGE